MSTKARVVLIMSAAIAAGAALADTPLGGPAGTPATPPAPPATPATPADPGAMITSTNATSLKQIFDEAGVPAEIKTTEKGYSFLIGKPQGYDMAVYPSDCEGDSLNGKCSVVALESGTWNKVLTADQANKFNQGIQLADAMMYDDAQGHPVIEYSFAVVPGVSQTYIRGMLRNFVSDMGKFHDYIQTVGSAATPSGTPAGGGVFGKEKNGGASAVSKPDTLRAPPGEAPHSGFVAN